MNIFNTNFNLVSLYSIDDRYDRIIDQSKNLFYFTSHSDKAPISFEIYFFQKKQKKTELMIATLKQTN